MADFSADMQPDALQHLAVPDCRYYASVTSTNDLASDWAADGAMDGSLVIADTQTAGRGRLDRRWVTPPDSALAFSLVLRPTPQECQKLALFSPLGGLALCLALESCQLQPQIKWPNDVLLHGKKTAGILAETIWQGDAPQAVILGIGVNVSPKAVPPAEEVLFPATCVEEAAGRPVPRWELLAAILEQLFAWRKLITSPVFLQAWETRLAFVGKRVQLMQPNHQIVSGIVAGISPEGGLRLTLADGREQTFSAGDVHLRPFGENPVQ